MPEQLELLLADAAAWRTWLCDNHTDPTGVWLVLARKGTTSPTSLTYPQALDEALCFGWIDGQIRRRDEATTFQRFTPRRSRSPWSRRNVGHVARLQAAGLMHPAGVAEVERAKADGRWAAAYDGQAEMSEPADLLDALAASPRAHAMWQILTRGNRYAVLYQVHQAKRAETRARRIAMFVAMLERGQTPHPQKATLTD